MEIDQDPSFGECASHKDSRAGNNGSLNNRVDGRVGDWVTVRSEGVDDDVAVLLYSFLETSMWSLLFFEILLSFNDDAAAVIVPVAVDASFVASE